MGQSHPRARRPLCHVLPALRIVTYTSMFSVQSGDILDEAWPELLQPGEYRETPIAQ